MLPKAKESYLRLAKGLLALAKGATPDSGGRERQHSHSRLKLRLSCFIAHIIVIITIIITIIIIIIIILSFTVYAGSI